jgi:SNF2 family DNA or RNA helicase
MGMGKTLMALSTILFHRMSPQSSLSEFSNLPPVKATLIITPTTILNQWIQETERNCPDLSFYIFQVPPLLVSHFRVQKASLLIRMIIISHFSLIMILYLLPIKCFKRNFMLLKLAERGNEEILDLYLGDPVP